MTAPFGAREMGDLHLRALGHTGPEKGMDKEQSCHDFFADAETKYVDGSGRKVVKNYLEESVYTPRRSTP